MDSAGHSTVSSGSQETNDGENLMQSSVASQASTDSLDFTDNALDPDPPGASTIDHLLPTAANSSSSSGEGQPGASAGEAGGGALIAAPKKVRPPVSRTYSFEQQSFGDADRNRLAKLVPENVATAICLRYSEKSALDFTTTSPASGVVYFLSGKSVSAAQAHIGGQAALTLQTNVLRARATFHNLDNDLSIQRPIFEFGTFPGALATKQDDEVSADGGASKQSDQLSSSSADVSASNGFSSETQILESKGLPTDFSYLTRGPLVKVHAQRIPAYWDPEIEGGGLTIVPYIRTLMRYGGMDPLNRETFDGVIDLFKGCIRVGDRTPSCPISGKTFTLWQMSEFTPTINRLDNSSAIGDKINGGHVIGNIEIIEACFNVAEWGFEQSGYSSIRLVWVKILSLMRERFDPSSQDDVELAHSTHESTIAQNLKKNSKTNIQMAGEALCTPRSAERQKQSESYDYKTAISSLVRSCINGDSERLGWTKSEKKAFVTRYALVIQISVQELLLKQRGLCAYGHFPISLENGPFHISLDRRDNMRSHFPLRVDTNGQISVDMSNIVIIARVLQGQSRGHDFDRLKLLDVFNSSPLNTGYTAEMREKVLEEMSNIKEIEAQGNSGAAAMVTSNYAASAQNGATFTLPETSPPINRKLTRQMKIGSFFSPPRQDEKAGADADAGEPRALQASHTARPGGALPKAPRGIRAHFPPATSTAVDGGAAPAVGAFNDFFGFGGGGGGGGFGGGDGDGGGDGGGAAPVAGAHLDFFGGGGLGDGDGAGDKRKGGLLVDQGKEKK